MLKLVVGAVLLVCVSADVSQLLRQPRLLPSVIAALPSYPAQQPQSAEQASTILRQSQDVSPDGSYQWAYETSNGIAAQEEGRPAQISPEQVAEQVSGSFSYPAPDGQNIALSYIANENGFQPQGAHLPTPPPIPPEIQRSLEFNARNAPPQPPQ